MSHTRTVTRSEFQQLLRETLLNKTFVQLQFSKPRTADGDGLVSARVRPIMLNEGRQFQITSRRNRQEVHSNCSADETAEHVMQLLGPKFLTAHLATVAADYTVRVKGAQRVRLREAPPQSTAPSLQHDREKQYLIPEGEPCRFLEAIGVMTAEGRVRASRRKKFRQVNRFLELVNDIVPALPAEGMIRVVDFGCGKSYLTFAVHHLLTVVHGREVRMTGLDRNQSVVNDCARISSDLSCRGLEFHGGDIAAFEADGPVHLAISLHACDTATDDALAQAMSWQSDVILAVPCCQHELAAQLDASSMAGVLKHGILRERLGAIVTDALRAEVLERCGYQTQVVEFIDMEHTAKNVLIRGIRRQDSTRQRSPGRRTFDELKQLFGLNRIYLEGAVQRTAACGDSFRPSDSS